MLIAVLFLACASDKSEAVVPEIDLEACGTIETDSSTYFLVGGEALCPNADRIMYTGQLSESVDCVWWCALVDDEVGRWTVELEPDKPTDTGSTGCYHVTEQGPLGPDECGVNHDSGT